MALGQLLDQFGPEIEDPEEETFLLFSQDIPSQNLGFVDSHATTVDLTINGKDYTIHQSPTILNRPGSTTGAVIWKITPLIASWLSSPSNILFKTGFLSSSSSVLELGCGISGLVGLTLSPMVSQYVLTDQPYVARLVERNLEENAIITTTQQQQQKSNSKRNNNNKNKSTNLRFTSLDWELDEVPPSLASDVVIACDCIYNETLIKPLVQTCADVCGLRQQQQQQQQQVAICIVAQQLRDPEIFEGWIKEFSSKFRVWRIPETFLSKELRDNTGFVVHVGVLKDMLN
ncbi:hypothetical protein GGS20DRAFT_358810 [Poronia punctata]|nr:hypothetical protein GGS20DRAFT_358810 [Poronia punctata]